jgi:hypothetical protein
MYGLILYDNNKLIFTKKLKMVNKLNYYFQFQNKKNKTKQTTIIINKNNIEVNGKIHITNIWHYLNVYISEFKEIQIYLFLDNNKTIFATNNSYQKSDDYTIITYNSCLFFKNKRFTLYRNRKVELDNEYFNNSFIYLIYEIYKLEIKK